MLIHIVLKLHHSLRADSIRLRALLIRIDTAQHKTHMDEIIAATEEYRTDMEVVR